MLVDGPAGRDPVGPPRRWSTGGAGGGGAGGNGGASGRGGAASTAITASATCLPAPPPLPGPPLGRHGQPRPDLAVATHPSDVPLQVPHGPSSSCDGSVDSDEYGLSDDEAYGSQADPATERAILSAHAGGERLLRRVAHGAFDDWFAAEVSGNAGMLDTMAADTTSRLDDLKGDAGKGAMDLLSNWLQDEVPGALVASRHSRTLVVMEIVRAFGCGRPRGRPVRAVEGAERHASGLGRRFRTLARAAACALQQAYDALYGGGWQRATRGGTARAAGGSAAASPSRPPSSSASPFPCSGKPRRSAQAASTAGGPAGR